MAEKEYIILCDESDKKGAFYSNFYGGVLVGGSQYKRISERLDAKKQELHLFGEVKWEKVTQQYMSKYIDLTRVFFEEIAAGHLKVRIMFRQNAHEPRGLSQEQKDLGYFLLYYQFIKHGFGLAYLQNDNQDASLRLYFDRLPDTAERCAQFKGHLHALQETKLFSGSRIRIDPTDITEVHSHNHPLVQCLDIVLGSMSFRLNEKHQRRDKETKKRGKRTVAKEALYRFILGEIQKIRPNFNVGISTGRKEGQRSLWLDPYRHWNFYAKDSVYRSDRTKRGKRKNPTAPT
jgi:hypothetical protein